MILKNNLLFTDTDFCNYAEIGKNEKVFVQSETNPE